MSLHTAVDFNYILSKCDILCILLQKQDFEKISERKNKTKWQRTELKDFFKPHSSMFSHAVMKVTGPKISLHVRRMYSEQEEEQFFRMVKREV